MLDTITYSKLSVIVVKIALSITPEASSWALCKTIGEFSFPNYESELKIGRI